MSIESRLKRIEANVGDAKACPECAYTRIVVIEEGETAPPPGRCPKCGGDANRLVILEVVVVSTHEEAQAALKAAGMTP